MRLMVKYDIRQTQSFVEITLKKGELVKSWSQVRALLSILLCQMESYVSCMFDISELKKGLTLMRG